MMYFKKMLKVLTVALVVCVLLFSVTGVNAATSGPYITFAPLPSFIMTIPPYVFNTPIPWFTPAPADTSPLVNFSDELSSALTSVLGVSPLDMTENYIGSLTGTLDLSGQELSSIKGIEYFDGIDYLILRDNPISSKNELKRLKQMASLESLDISALSFTTLPSEIAQISNLKFLDISANRIDSLPSNFGDLNLDVLLCNYCFFDITDTGFANKIIAATAAADYQYQLQKIDLYGTCQTAGTVVMHWEEMPDIEFPNGAVARVQRYSICKPNPSGNQGAWIDSESRSSTSYTFTGLDAGTTYSFDISVDYYIDNTQYDGKYIKFYEKELFQPIPQDTPTPKPTETPVPTDTPVITPTPEVITATPIVTQAPADIITINPNQQVNNNQQQNPGQTNSMLTILTILVVVLIVVILGLIVVLFIRMRNMGTGSNNNNRPRR